MEDKQYKVRILPLFEEDLNDAVDYISQTLKNPNAALRLIDSVQNAIEKRAWQAESFEPFRSTIMEVRRLLYNRKNYEGTL